MAKYPAFVGGSYVSQSPLADQERTINWYVEPIEGGGASTEAALYPTPGVETVIDLTYQNSAGGRAHIFADGREFCIHESKSVFNEIFEDGTGIDRGTIAMAIDSNPATISYNGDGGGQLFITCGGNGYCFDLATNVLSQITNLTGKATMGDAIDGYFLCLDASTSTVYISALFDGLTWDPTQLIQRNQAPDAWVSMKVSNKYIYLLGSNTGEVWYDAGTFPIPFEPHPSGLFQYGCAAAFSPEVVGSTLCWLGSTANGIGVVLNASGVEPKVISTFATAVAFNDLPLATISDAIGDSYDDLGHTFYVLTFPTGNATWVWDSQTGVWHERGTWDPATMIYTAWRPLYHAFCFGEHRILDFSTTKVYRMSSSLGSDVDGKAIRRLRRAPGIVHENQRMFYGSFELNVEPGLGLSSGQGSDPQVMMRMSNDGGKTWGAETWKTAGAMGDYGRRVRWTRCGSARKRVFEIAVSDPIPWRIMGAWLDPLPGADN